MSDDFVTLGLAGLPAEAFATKRQQQAQARSSQGQTIEDYKPDILIQALIDNGQEYSPEDQDLIRREANRGDGRRRAALGQEMKRLIVGVQLDKAKEMLQNCSTTFEPRPKVGMNPDDETPEASLAREIAEYEEEQWKPWLRDIYAIRTDVLYHGWGACRVITEARGGGKSSLGVERERIVDIKDYAARRFRFDYASRDYPKWLLCLDTRGQDTIVVEDLEDTGELIFWETQPGEALDQRGWLFMVGIAWGIAQYCLRWWAKKVEIHAIPPLYGVYDTEVGGSEQAMNVQLRKMRAGFSASGPKGSSITPITTISGGGSDLHQELFEQCFRLIDQTILGHDQASGTRVGTGSQKANEIALEQMREKTNSRAMDFERPFREAAIRPQVQRNYGRSIAGNFTPWISMKALKRDDPMELATIASIIKRSGGGSGVNLEKLVKRVGLDFAREGEISLSTNDPKILPEGGVPDENGRLLDGKGRFRAELAEGFELIAGRYGMQGARAMAPIFALVNEAADQGDMGIVAETLRHLTNALASSTLESAVLGRQDAKAEERTA